MTLLGALKREIIGLGEDYAAWKARLSRRWRGLGDLRAGRMTPQRDEAVSVLRAAGLVLLAFAVLYLAGQFMPVGYDWNCCFSTRNLAPFFVPWTYPILDVINPSSLFALTLLGLALRVRQYGGSAWVMGLAIVSLPTLWLLHLGNIDGLVIIGLLLMPVGVPLVLLKPQIAAFALLASHRRIAAAVAWGVISLVIWGFWPARFFGIGGEGWKADWPQDITLFPWGILIALPLLWLSRGDEDMLMAAGSFGTPHLFPYHFVLLMPALARMDKFWAFASWLLCWTPLLANYFGPLAWHFGNLFSGCVWLGLHIKRRGLRVKREGTQT